MALPPSPGAMLALAHLVDPHNDELYKAGSAARLRAMSAYSHPIFRYSAALALTLGAVLIWSLWAPLHESPFIVFIAAVMLAARYFGFGPGIFATALSLFLIDYVVLEP